jgi:hypothetical protein
VNVHGLGRLGILAVGLGIGAAVAHSPVASADSSDWLSSIDSLFGGGALPAPAVSGLNLDISFDGSTIYSSGSATAFTEVGQYGLAIAYGANSVADAGGGTGDYALADGTDANAEAGGPVGDANNFDSAVDIGNNTGTDDDVTAGEGSDDSAIQIGNNSGVDDFSFAGDGNGNSATDIGNNSGNGDAVEAEFGNSETADDYGNNTESGVGSDAENGNHDVAEASGANSGADAGGYTSTAPSNYDIAYVSDPSGTAGSFADAGGTAANPGGDDLAAVLGVDDTYATANGAPALYDIVTALGNESGTAAATSGGLLGELLSLF